MLSKKLAQFPLIYIEQNFFDYGNFKSTSSFIFQWNRVGKYLLLKIIHNFCGFCSRRHKLGTTNVSFVWDHNLLKYRHNFLNAGQLAKISFFFFVLKMNLEMRGRCISETRLQLNICSASRLSRIYDKVQKLLGLRKKMSLK